MSGLPYDCDPEKAAANLRKHRVSFDEGFKVISLPPERLLTVQDSRWEYGEERWIAIGPHPEVPSLVLHITYTWRGNLPRLISVRRANARERRQHANRYRRP